MATKLHNFTGSILHMWCHYFRLHASLFRQLFTIGYSPLFAILSPSNASQRQPPADEVICFTWGQCRMSSSQPFLYSIERDMLQVLYG